MRRIAFLCLALALLSPFVLSAVVDISYSQAGTTFKPNDLARVSYDTTNLHSEILSWTPPKLTEKSLPSLRLLSIQVANGGSTLTTLSAFNETLRQVLTLHLGVQGSVYSVSISAQNPQSFSEPSEPRRLKKESNPQVILQPSTPGPIASLNHRKPVKVDQTGKEVPAPEQEREKTFLQKYWWVFLLVTILALGGGGDK